MESLRLVLTAVALFGVAFVGVSLASKGFPTTAGRAVPAKPAVQVAALEQDVKPEQGIREPEQSAKEPPVPAPTVQQQQSVAVERPAAAPPPARTAVIDRDQLALTTIQAADAYVRSPCDMAARAAFVVAASTYLRTKAAHLETAAPSDARARRAIKAAADAGRIGRDEFPSGTEIPDGVLANSRTRLPCISSAGLRP